jgi:hypothetical protein
MKFIKDELGNERTPTQVTIVDGLMHISYSYRLEAGKTTLRGEYPKLASDATCRHPDRLSCNFGEGFSRCEHMKYIGGGWRCQSKEGN